MRIEPGRVAVVTGGASGIGYALAAAAASRGRQSLPGAPGRP
jgi:NAD(P)-dependent dehydrogenase (short-subunit alcohol dehydrogenase family)